MLIQKHSYGCGGIGDFLRSALSFYSFCKRFNVSYYIDFSENINFGKCFVVNPIPDYNIIDSENITLLNGVYNYDDISLILDKIKSNNKIYILKSNAIGFENNEFIKLVVDEFFTKILVLNENVINKINDLYKTFNLQENNYISVHIRCGDKNMTNNNNSLDNRIDINNKFVYDEYTNLINKFVKNDEYKIVIFTDSIFFKEKILEKNNFLINLNVNIKHVAENIGVNDVNYFIDTISEFYIMSKSKCIYSFGVYSGFSHLASIVNNKPLYVNYKSGYFSLLNNNNVKNIN